MTIYDISQPIAPGVVVWPGDTPFTVTWNRRLEEGAPVNLSDIRMSVHTGTHADAPFHFSSRGASIDAVELSRYLGPARVVRVASAMEVPLDAVQGFDWSRLPRCLLQTGSCPDSGKFHSDLMPISREAAEYLLEQEVVLIGTDAHSIDAADSKELPIHHMLGRSGVAILENLVLAHVPPGEYDLVALPLRLQGLDASPLRAILRSL